MNPFQSLRNYEEFIYTLNVRHSAIHQSTLVIAPHGKRTAVLQGDLLFARGYRLSIRERLSFDENIFIEFYGYELWHLGEKIAWYDAQPHPNNPSLQENHPHHKHVPPDIKHNRIPAPQMSFDQPNLPMLIEEIERLVRKAAG